MLVTTTIFPEQSHIKYCIQVKNKSSIGWDSNPGLPRAGENSTTEPPMLIMSTIYPAQSHIKYCIHVKK